MDLDPRPVPALDEFHSESGRARPRSPARYRVAAGLVLTLLSAAAAVWGFAGASAMAPRDGVLTVLSEPGPSDVRIDGVARGATPVTVAVAAGQHELAISRAGRTRRMMLTVRPGADTVHHVEWIELHEQTVAPPRPSEPATGAEEPAVVVPAAVPPPGPVTVSHGTLAVSSPISVQVYEGTRLLGSSDTPRLALPAGTHALAFVAEALGFRATRVVRIVADQTTAVTVTVPEVPVYLNATPWADVWIGGRSVGQTPIGDLLQPVGVHEVEFRHPQLGTQRRTLTVTATGAARLAVDMRTP